MDLPYSKLLKCQVMLINENNEKTIMTSLNSTSFFNAFNFKSSKTDEILRNLNDYVTNNIDKENYDVLFEKVTKYFEQAVNKDSISCIISDVENSIEEECKRNMKKDELLNYRSEPRLYSSREYLAIERFNKNEFSQFFINEIRCMLNFIERYKSKDVFFTFPKDIKAIYHTFVYDGFHVSECQLDKELEILYKKFVIVYSTLFSKNFSSIKYRKGILKELKFLKGCLQFVAFEMDRRFMRLKKYMIHFGEQYIKKEIGVSTSKRLEDLLELPSSYFTDLERENSKNKSKSWKKECHNNLIIV
uniref:Uncharacterized protein n=1 Tax=Strongyloides stercoralis TaxID=6248 RepID=A0AAF5DMJ4_STRER